MISVVPNIAKRVSDEKFTYMLVIFLTGLLLLAEPAVLAVDVAVVLGLSSFLVLFGLSTSMICVAITF